MTEEQLRHETRKEFSFSEERDKERIDKAVQMKKDRFTAIQQKKKIREQLEGIVQPGDPKGNKKVEEPKGKEDVFTVEDSARLQEAKIPVDDWKEVKNWVKYKKMSDPKYTYKKALDDKILLNTLKERLGNG